MHFGTRNAKRLLEDNIGGDSPTCNPFSSSWLNALLKCDYGQHESTVLE